MNENPARRDIPAVVFFDVDGTLISHDPAANAAQNDANARPSEGMPPPYPRIPSPGHKPYKRPAPPPNQ